MAQHSPSRFGTILVDTSALYAVLDLLPAAEPADPPE